jgi:hypothetical protein
VAGIKLEQAADSTSGYPADIVGIHSTKSAAPVAQADAAAGECTSDDAGLRKILVRMPYLSSLVDYHVIEYYDMRGRGRSLAQFPKRMFNDVDIVWEQLGTDFAAEREQFHGLIAKRKPPIILFPPFTINTLWPFMGADKRLVRLPAQTAIPRARSDRLYGCPGVGRARRLR